MAVPASATVAGARSTARSAPASTVGGRFVVKRQAGEPRQSPRASRVTTRQWKTSPLEASDARYVGLRLPGGHEGKLPERVGQQPEVGGRKRELVVGPSRDDEAAGALRERRDRREPAGRDGAAARHRDPRRLVRLAGADENPGVGEDVVEALGHGPRAAAVDEEPPAGRVVGDGRPEPRRRPLGGRLEPAPGGRGPGASGNEHVHVAEGRVVAGAAAEQDETVLAGVEREARVASRRRRVAVGHDLRPGRLRTPGRSVEHPEVGEVLSAGARRAPEHEQAVARRVVRRRGAEARSGAGNGEEPPPRISRGAVGALQHPRLAGRGVAAAAAAAEEDEPVAERGRSPRPPRREDRGRPGRGCAATPARLPTRSRSRGREGPCRRGPRASPRRRPQPIARLVVAGDGSPTRAGRVPARAGGEPLLPAGGEGGPEVDVVAEGVGGVGVGRRPGEPRGGDARGAVGRAASRVRRRRPVGAGVVVQHAHGRLAASEDGPRGVPEKDGELLVSLGGSIPDDGDEDAPLGLARRERHAAVAPAVVAGTDGRPVLGDEVDRDRRGPRLREPERDAGPGEALVAFADHGVLDVEGRRGLGEQRHPDGVGGRELPVVGGEAQIVDTGPGEGRRGRGTRRRLERDGTGTAEEAPGDDRRRENPPVVRDRAPQRGRPLGQGDRQVGPGVDRRGPRSPPGRRPARRRRPTSSPSLAVSRST